MELGSNTRDGRGLCPLACVHGDFVQIWLNEAANNALTTGSDLPDGAIIAKQTFDDTNGDTLKRHYGNAKIEGFNPEGNGMVLGAILRRWHRSERGSPAMCTGCHARWK